MRFSLKELEAEIKKFESDFGKVTIEYPDYIQAGEIAFGWDLDGLGGYTYNNNTGTITGFIDPLPTVEEVVAEFRRHILYGAEACGACGEFFPLSEADSEGFHKLEQCTAYAEEAN